MLLLMRNRLKTPGSEFAVFFIFFGFFGFFREFIKN